MAQWGGPVCQEVFHDVVDGRGPRQGPVSGAEPDLLLCGGEGGRVRAQRPGFLSRSGWRGSRASPVPPPLPPSPCPLGLLIHLRAGCGQLGQQPSPNIWQVSMRKQDKTRLVPCGIRGQN